MAQSPTIPAGRQQRLRRSLRHARRPPYEPDLAKSLATCRRVILTLGGSAQLAVSRGSIREFQPSTASVTGDEESMPGSWRCPTYSSIEAERCGPETSGPLTTNEKDELSKHASLSGHSRCWFQIVDGKFGHFGISPISRTLHRTSNPAPAWNEGSMMLMGGRLLDSFRQSTNFLV